jgi:hypothetical protein
MRVTSHRVGYKYGDSFNLKPIADVHLGSKACDVKAFKEFLADSDEKTLFLGIGDLLDCIIVKDMKRYRKSGDDTYGDAVVDEQIDRAEEILTPYKDRIVGLGHGNHEDTIIKVAGTNPMKRLCKRLDVPFLGLSGLVRLTFGLDKQKGGRGRTVIIRYHHGWGGGSRTQGADLTKFSKDISYWDADIYLYGHVHRQQTDSVPRLGLSGDKLISKPKIICICGTFLKTYLNGDDPTYSELKGYPPVEIGGVCITIKPHRRWVKMRSFIV